MAIRLMKWIFSARSKLICGRCRMFRWGNFRASSATSSARADQDGFEIEVVQHEGAQTILGFGTPAEAEAWLIRSARLNREPDPTGFRVLWRF